MTTNASGWRCPGCSRCYAPWVSRCSACEPSSYVTTTGNATAMSTLSCDKCGGPTETSVNGMCVPCFKLVVGWKR